MEGNAGSLVLAVGEKLHPHVAAASTTRPVTTRVILYIYMLVCLGLVYRDRAWARQLGRLQLQQDYELGFSL